MKTNNSIQSKFSSAFRLQAGILVLAILLFLVKYVAYLLTHSVVVLTDALESIVNIIAGGVGLYSIWLAGLPRDRNHPYGHGKAEFLSAGSEGTMILLAGMVICYQAVFRYYTGSNVHEAQSGFWLTFATAALNGLAGWYCLQKGKKSQSLILQSSGIHLLSDTWTSGGVLLALGLVQWTGWANWDVIIAFCLGVFMVITGWRILRTSLAGIMDEADLKVLESLIQFCEAQRMSQWIDLHNLRIIKYGSILHMDCHMTLPWYYNLHEAHREMDRLTGLIRQEFGAEIEFFIHMDGCLPFSCAVCSLENCKERKETFKQKIPWTLDNVLRDEKHKIV